MGDHNNARRHGGCATRIASRRIAIHHTVRRIEQIRTIVIEQQFHSSGTFEEASAMPRFVSVLGDLLSGDGDAALRADGLTACLGLVEVVPELNCGDPISEFRATAVQPGNTIGRAVRAEEAQP